MQQLQQHSQPLAAQQPKSSAKRGIGASRCLQDDVTVLLRSMKELNTLHTVNPSKGVQKSDRAH